MRFSGKSHIIKPKKGKNFKHKVDNHPLKDLTVTYRLKIPGGDWEPTDPGMMGKYSRSMTIVPKKHLEFKTSDGLTEIEPVVDEQHIFQKLYEKDLKIKDVLLVVSLEVPENTWFDEEDLPQVMVNSYQEEIALRKQSIKLVK